MPDAFTKFWKNTRAIMLSFISTSCVIKWLIGSRKIVNAPKYNLYLFYLFVLKSTTFFYKTLPVCPGNLFTAK